MGHSPGFTIDYSQILNFGSIILTNTLNFCIFHHDGGIPAQEQSKRKLTKSRLLAALVATIVATALAALVTCLWSYYSHRSDDNDSEKTTTNNHLQLLPFCEVSGTNTSVSVRNTLNGNILLRLFFFSEDKTTHPTVAAAPKCSNETSA
jgi:hypothetical protein